MLGIDEQPLPGVANVGTRPTVTGDSSVILEAHLLDFSADIYGRMVEVVFHEKLRVERRFSDLAELSVQIAKDVESARNFFRGGIGI
jgi:riboflavin kinase/FMN adenylyltransferase